ncbi:hypothetical protein C8K36_10482 [Rhodococcus sp. OK519]|uniref:hypothetical protein n=1 Tax=Rhodococcus sp. OK519 TaxID=2135729 RepID=UPI000D44FD55|nr:hypothetical protein C8K36_10482 [Rhodococcus sp. OK519]
MTSPGQDSERPSQAEPYAKPSLTLKRFDNQPQHNAADVPQNAWILESRRIHDLSLLSSQLATRARRRTRLEELIRVRSRPHRNLISRETDIDEPRLANDDPIRKRHGRRHRRDICCPRTGIASANATPHCKNKPHHRQTHHHTTYPHHNPLGQLKPPYKTTIPPTKRIRTQKQHPDPANTIDHTDERDRPGDFGPGPPASDRIEPTSSGSSPAAPP